MPCISSTQWLPETIKDNKEERAQEMVKYSSSHTGDFFVKKRFKVAEQYQFLYWHTKKDLNFKNKHTHTHNV